jgi:outer membrane receptor protein involved in Fe transport
MHLIVVLFDWWRIIKFCWPVDLGVQTMPICVLLRVTLLSFLFACPAFAQVISGVVTDPAGAAVVHADVVLLGGKTESYATVTDVKGQFSLPAREGSGQLLRVSASGFDVFERPLSGLSEPISIVLQPQLLREDVTVSITRTESRLGQTPASIVVLDRQTLETTAAQTIDDSLRQVAGFTLFRRSSSKTTNPTTQGANLRGIGGSGAARTSVLFDGISLNDAFGGWTYWSRVPSIAIEQIEVLRGGASSLYGSSALSGAINLSPPKRKSPVLRFDASGGSEETYSASTFGAYATHGWNFDVAAESFQTAGYIPMSEEDRGTVDTRANSRHNSVLASIERRFAEGFRVFLRSNLFGERRDNGTSLTNNRTYFRQAALGADYSNGKLGTFQVRSSIDAQVYDQTFSAVAAGRNSETLTRVQRVPSRSAAFSAVWTRPFADHTFLAAADARYVRGFSDETAISGDRATALISSGGHEASFGVFAQDLWRATRKMTINFGARFDRWRNFDAFSRTRSLTGGSNTLIRFTDRSQQRLSLRIGALYQVTRSIALFAGYNSSFRAPSLNELYRAFRVGNVVTLANEDLKAETADTIEGGANFTGMRRRLNIRGNAFVAEVSDPVVSVTLSTTPTLITRQRQNVGKTRTRGVELDAEFSPSPRIRLSASYVFADSRVAEFDGTESLIGKMLPQIPRHQFTFQTMYRPATRISLGVQGRVSGAQFDDDLNTLRLRPFFAVDAFASYRFPKKFEIFAAAENLLNSRYDIGLTPNRTIAAPWFMRLGVRFDLTRNSR